MLEFLCSVPFVVWCIIFFVIALTYWWIAGEIYVSFRGLLLNLEVIAKQLKKYKTQLTINEVNEIEEIFITAKFRDTYYLKDIWVEFDETLEKDKRNNKVFNTLQSEDFFNEQSIIIANIKRLEIVKAGPGILTALGLLGTFLAILLGLQEVEILQGGQVVGIEGLINGLAAKFTSSIIALFCSIILTYLEKRYHSKLIRTCADIQRSMNRIFPRRSTEKLLIQLLKHSEEQEAALKSFSTDMSGHLKAGIQDGISPLIERLVDSIEEIKKEKQQSSEFAISSMVNDFKNSLTGSANSEINNMANVIQNATAIMANFTDNNQELESRVDFLVSSLETTIQHQQNQFLEYIENVNSKMASQMANTQNIINDLGEKMEQYRALIISTKELQENMKRIADNLVNAGENFIESADNFGQINRSIEQLKTINEQESIRFKESISQWNVQVDAIKAVENSISNILEKVHTSLVGYSEHTSNSLKEYLAQYDEQMTNVTRHFSSSILEFDETLENFNEILNKKSGANVNE